MARLLLSLLCLSVLGASGQEVSRSSAPPADPVCGFLLGPHFYFEAEQIKQGFAVDLLVPKAQINQLVSLRFSVSQKPKGLPVDKLQIEHEKFIHVIGVRDDLGEFFHLHPQRVGPGIWQATHTFKQGGNYKLWADVKFRGTSYSFGQALLSVSGDFGPPVPREESPGSVTCSGYRIKLDQSRPWRITETNQLQFLIEDSTGKPAELDNYLGAPMHLVIVHEDLSAYLHAHPEGRRPGDAHIRFNQSLPKPGYYQLFAQFRPRAANLPPDEAILAEFCIKVPAL